MNQQCFISIMRHNKGNLSLDTLGLLLSYTPGTIVIIHGRVILYEVQEWKGKQRVCVAHFIHESDWEKGIISHLEIHLHKNTYKYIKYLINFIIFDMIYINTLCFPQVFVSGCHVEISKSSRRN